VTISLVVSNACNSFLQDNRITVKYRLDGKLFNQRHLNAQSKTSVTHSYELQYTDDTALVSHTADGLQQLLDGMFDAYSRAGLVVNIKKTNTTAVHLAKSCSTYFQHQRQPHRQCG